MLYIHKMPYSQAHIAVLSVIHCWKSV